MASGIEGQKGAGSFPVEDIHGNGEGATAMPRKLEKLRPSCYQPREALCGSPNFNITLRGRTSSSAVVNVITITVLDLLPETSSK